MEKILISQYSHIKDPQSVNVDINDFLQDIKNGKWQDIVLKVRTIADKKERSIEKQKCPNVTISGSFRERKDSGLIKHSGFIAIDIDNQGNPETIKKIIKNDPYIYSAFVSISGNGLCLLFKIDGTRHSDAFKGLEKYIVDNYQIVVDVACKNLSRTRFVSYDPSLYINEKAAVFKKYLPKEKQIPKKFQFVYQRNDFDRIVNEMLQRGINICEDYQGWIKTGFALVSKFGEEGREYYHKLSSISSKYHSENTDRQYDNCLKSFSLERDKVCTIDFIYYSAKQEGIEIYSEKVNKVIRTAASKVKSGIKNVDTIKKSIQEHENIDGDFSEEIISQVISKNIEYKSDNLIDDIVFFLKPYKLKKNVITRNIELKGKPIDDSDINSIFLDIKIFFPDVTKDLICSILFSNRIPSYNPIHDFLNSQVDVNSDCPNLNLLIESIESDTNDFDIYITKWLVSIIASAYGKHSPLVLVFCGEEQGTGKTHWFRYLLPQKIQSLFAESKMDAGKDDEILMTKKWIILDDEYGGKSKKEEKRLKEITSKQWINVREPYGRVQVDLKRLAVFCGTSNDTQILNDPTGNRRILPIHILKINHQKYNQCDKEALFGELYGLYKSGYDYTILKEEIIRLNQNTEDFKASSPEEELIAAKLKQDTYGEWLNITQIIQYLILDTKYTNLSNTKIGMILNKLGFEKKRAKVNGSVVKVFKVSKVEQSNSTPSLPF